MPKQRILIIGAGPCGLSSLIAFKTANVSETHEVVCYEKQSTMGGLWNYTWRTGMDKNGKNVHGSMYPHLWSNAPKESFEVPNYTFDEHFGKPIGSYPPRAVIEDYLKGRANKKFNVTDQITLNTSVDRVQFNEATQKFEVESTNHEQKQSVQEEFDWVIVATGHFSVPNAPEFPGFQEFEGSILHSHDFRDAKAFKDKNILILGSNYSAEDISCQLLKYGCKSIVSSYRSRPMDFNWPENFSSHPLLEKMEGQTAIFKDGSSAENIDAIILATGYQHDFFFIADNLKLKTPNTLYPAHLWKGVVFDKNPKIHYLGMQDQCFTFNMFDLMAWFARDVILGKIEIPSIEEREIDSNLWIEKFSSIQNVTAPDCIDYQMSYMKDLMERTDYPEFNVDGQAQLLKQWVDKKFTDKEILTFRDYAYPSMLGGHGVVQNKKWFENTDDSLESFVKNE